MYVESVYSELTRSYHDLRYFCNSVTHEGLLLIHSWCFHAESQQLLDVATDDWRVDHGWTDELTMDGWDPPDAPLLATSRPILCPGPELQVICRTFPEKEEFQLRVENVHRNLGVDMEIPSLTFLKPQISAALEDVKTQKKHFHTKSYQNHP